MRNIDENIINQLKKELNVLGIYLFGSVVRGNQGKLSDVDIGVVFDQPEKVFNNPKNSLSVYERLFDIFASLVQNSNKLDLVFLQKTPLSLQKEVINEGELIYAKDIQKMLNFKERVILNYADFKPVINYFHKQILERGFL